MPDQQMDVTLKRACLQERVEAFQKQAAAILQASGDSWDRPLVRETYIGAEFDGIDEGEENDECSSPAEECDQVETMVDWSANASIDAEYIPLHFPLHFGHNWCSANAAKDLVEAELCLREGQLNDSLHHIRIALGHKSFLFRHDRPAHTQRLKTRAWAKVHAVESTVPQHAWAYVHGWKAMVDLGAGADLLDQYKVLRRQDLSVKTTVILPQVRGQWNESLAWFWTMDVWWDTEVGEWMEDCTSPFCPHSFNNLNIGAVYRVHWLRAKAQKMRWIEELQCLQVEMDSAVRFFRHQEGIWCAKEGAINPQSWPGHTACAARQSAMWRSIAIQAESKFSTLLENDPPPKFAKVLQPCSST
jgi:hypothetical protein